jgi:hypothetical protein
MVQVLTWNDYGESHYVGPIKGAQPNSQAWTDGMNHTGVFSCIVLLPFTEHNEQDGWN